MISRRNFIAGTAATVAALAAGPKVLTEGEWVQIASFDNQYIVPLLWGDGVHDDTDAFRALMSGLPLETVPGNYILNVTDDLIHLDGGVFLIDSELKPFNWTSWVCGSSTRVLLSNLTLWPRNASLANLTEDDPFDWMRDERGTLVRERNPKSIDPDQLVYIVPQRNVF